MLRLLAVAAVAVAVGLLVGRGTLPTTADVTELGYTYSAKFLCGTISDGAGPLADGEYATAINVHNLQDYNVHIFKKAVLAPSEPQLGQPSAWKDLVIPPDAAFEIDCPDIRQLLLLEPPFPFLKGFVVIHSPAELDVWGVYTSALTLGGTTAGTDISEDIEVVPAKRQAFPWGCDGGADIDCDGCADVEEQGMNPTLGGLRDYLNKWDFYDVPAPTLGGGGNMGNRDKAISIGNDVLAVLEYSGTSRNGPPNAGPDGISGTADDRDYDDDKDSDKVQDGIAYDRTVGGQFDPGPPPRLLSDVPNGSISIGEDVLLVLDQSGHSCQALP